MNLTNHDIAWDKRTRAIADLIPPGSHVVEFGAGRCQLRNWLPIDCTYVPSDIVSADPILGCAISTGDRYRSCADKRPFRSQYSVACSST